MSRKSSVKDGVYFYNKKFIKRYRSVYVEFSEYHNKPFKVIKTIKKGFEHCDYPGTWIEMYKIQFEDGQKINAFGEEVCQLY